MLQMKTIEERYKRARYLVTVKGMSIDSACKKVSLSFQEYKELLDKEHSRAVKIESNIAWRSFAWYALFLLVALAGLLLFLLIT